MKKTIITQLSEVYNFLDVDISSGQGFVEITVTSESVGSRLIKGYPHFKNRLFDNPLYRMKVRGYDKDGNPVLEDFSVFRFGVKVDAHGNETIQGVADGTYVVDYYSSKAIGGRGGYHLYGEYFIHMMSVNEGRYDGNNGCIAIYGGLAQWNAFNTLISTLTYISYQTAASTGKINVIVNPAPTPEIPRVK